MRFTVKLRVGAIAVALATLVVSPTLAATSAQSAHRHHAKRFHGAAYTARRVANRDVLPYAPEYGFLRSVPPDAIRMPGYTFVPGRGIIGESCDLPTSACSNRYRDVQ